MTARHCWGCEMNNEINPLNSEWQKENCHSTFPGLLIFAGPIFAKLFFDHWQWVAAALMLWGICKTRGFWLQAMALPCVYLVLRGPLSVFVPAANAETAVACIYWAVAWYIRWFADGQDWKRKDSVRDWEGD
jgi:hypothetical protein